MFGLEGTQYLIYDWLQPMATWVMQDVQPKMVNAQLTLIFRMEQ
jgi:hypothetical protein